MAMMNGMDYEMTDMAPAGGFRAAIYCRLSKDDDLQGESASIANPLPLSWYFPAYFCAIRLTNTSVASSSPSNTAVTLILVLFFAICITSIKKARQRESATKSGNGHRKTCNLRKAGNA